MNKKTIILGNHCCSCSSGLNCPALACAVLPIETEASKKGAPDSAETVAVARVQRGDLSNTLSIAGEFKAFQDVDVHAKVAGYIKVIYVDVGDHVKAGQTLAILEVPELAAQLSGAQKPRGSKRARTNP